MQSMLKNQKVMQDLKARSGKEYAVQIAKGKAQLVILTKDAKRKTVVNPVSDWLPIAEAYELAAKTEI